MLASSLAQFGVTKVTTLTVPIAFDRGEILFGVRIYECVDEDKNALRHVEIFHPEESTLPEDQELPEAAEEEETSDRRRFFWLRMIMHYQLAVERAATAGRIPADEEEQIGRTQSLAHIAVAYPQRKSAFKSTTIEIKTARKLREHADESTGTQIGLSNAVGDVDVPDQTLTQFAAACLVGSDNLNIVRTPEYDAFEKSICQQMRDLIAARPGPGEWRIAHAEMHLVLERIRKKSDDPRHKLLPLLRAAGEAQLMYIYQFAAGAVLRNESVVQELSPVSLAYNRFAHAAQDRLGGIVPAIYPLWPICLKTPRIVKILLDIAKEPTSEARLKSLNQCLVEVIRAYVGILDLMGKRKTDVSLDSPIGRDIRTGRDVLPDATQTRLDTLSTAWGLLDEVLATIKDDPDVQVALSVVRDKLNGKAASRKFECSEGEISKKKARGLRKLRSALERQGLSKEDILGAFHDRPTSSSKETKTPATGRSHDGEPSVAPDDPRPGSSFA